MKKEIEYLEGKLNEIQYDSNLFKVRFGENKYIFGITSADNNMASGLGGIMQYNTLYQTLIDLDIKIKISFREAIRFAYSENVLKNFSIIEMKTNEEIWGYYYIENALFRTSSLWDMLAQFYRLYFKVQIKAHRVYYKKIFNPNSPLSNGFKEKATIISNYLNQENDISINDEWKGNHKFVNEIRNKMTHRNSPNVSVISDFDVNFKHHPSYLLKRIIEDYNMASKFILSILDEVLREMGE
ncbi:Cthe_2314 family HEPN domain-containing protein [Lysinibacillus sp. LZ02]|uniref:Cthe_2314 family HEPN domain-containing protein n=1 Tax=Lysinibacillus sp. LZ02 TaxID=3420668 RepID=UPI003D36781D